MKQKDNQDFVIKEDGTIFRDKKIDDLKKKIVADEPVSKTVKEDAAGPLGIILSFLFPIIGVCCFILMRGRVKNPIVYLYSALGGFFFALVMYIF